MRIRTKEEKAFMKPSQRFGIREFAASEANEHAFDSFILARAEAALGYFELVLKAFDDVARHGVSGSGNN